MRLARPLLGLLVGGALLAGCGTAGVPRALPEPTLAASASPTPQAAPDVQASRSASRPLAGVRIALDPGHQLGNHRFPARINRLVPAGGFRKPCNTTGTATDGGYPEATLNFAVATGVKKRLEALGAVVAMTRTSNSERRWGPCVNQRGLFGARVGADLEVSLHGDGARPGGRGFHVIAPVSRRPWTHDIAADSLRLAKALRSGLLAQGIPRSNYTAGGAGLVLRSDLGTLNLSDVPIAMIEVGNMRNASDARRMTTPAGRSRYVAAVVQGIRLYLAR